MNVKGIKFETVWVEYPDVERVAKEIGAEPTGMTPVGSTKYTVPFIHDPNTNATVSDSYKIAHYLDATYPAIRIFPEGTVGLQDAFQTAFGIVVRDKLPLLTHKKVFENVSPDSAKHVRSTRELWLGKTLEELSEGPEAQWKAFEEGYGQAAAWYDKNGKVFIWGDAITYADITAASRLLWIKYLLGENSKEWKNVQSWHGGRWVKFLDKFSKYAEA